MLTKCDCGRFFCAETFRIQRSFMREALKLRARGYALVARSCAAELPLLSVLEHHAAFVVALLDVEALCGQELTDGTQIQENGELPDPPAPFLAGYSCVA